MTALSSVRYQNERPAILGCFSSTQLHTAALQGFIDFLAAQTEPVSSSVQNISRPTSGVSFTAQGSLSVASTPTIAASAKPLILINTTTPPPAITHTTTASITATGTAASSDAAVLAGALLGLSKAGKSLSTDITLPPSRTSFVDSIEKIESQLHNLLAGLGGGTGSPPSCGIKMSRIRFRRNFLGDLPIWSVTSMQ